MLFLLQEGFFEFVEGDSVEGEVFRTLAEAGDAALVARHVFGCELCEGVEFSVTFDFIVFCHCEFCACRCVDDLVADGYAVIKEVEVGEFGVDEFICVEEGVFTHWFYH